VRFSVGPFVYRIERRRATVYELPLLRPVAAIQGQDDRFPNLEAKIPFEQNKRKSKRRWAKWPRDSAVARNL
jgi:hypothetical protein